MCMARGSKAWFREDGRKRGCIYTLAGPSVGRKRGSNGSSVQLCVYYVMRVSVLCSSSVLPGEKGSLAQCSPPGRRVPFERMKPPSGGCLGTNREFREEVLALERMVAGFLPPKCRRSSMRS
jgi:hypothetical protein